MSLNMRLFGTFFTGPLDVMTRRHLSLAVLVALIWGITFPLTAIALDVLPPLLLVALRYAIVAVPTLLFIPRPRVRLGWFFGYALGIGLGQFCFLYAGIAAGMPAGLASVVIQAVAPFSVIISVVVFRQRISGLSWAAVAVSVAGLVIIAVSQAQVASMAPVLLVLAAGLSWAVGNISSSRAEASNPLHLVLWSCLVSPIPMMLASLAIDGPERVVTSLSALVSVDGLPALGSVLAIGLLSTAFGYGAWTVLLERYPVSTVAPLSMLVPVSGMVASVFILGESVSGPELSGAVIVVAGVLGGTLVSMLRRPTSVPVMAVAS